MPVTSTVRSPTRRAAARLTGVSSTSTQRAAGTRSRATSRRSIGREGLGCQRPANDIASIDTIESIRAAMPRARTTREA